VTYVEEKCPSCGGPLPAASIDWLVCKFCGAELRPAPGAQYHIWPRIEEPPYAPENPRVSIAGVRFCVLGQLARGEHADVLLARRDVRLTEMVALKIARDGSDHARIGREWSSLGELSKMERDGEVHFKRLLPQRVLQGKVDGSERPASVFRWRSGFHWTFEDALAEHKGGVDPRAAVWLWKRVLDVLGWIHQGGWVHGAIVPAHLLIHPRDHGVVLVGWSNAKHGGSPSDDIAASARAVVGLLGAQSGPIAELAREQSSAPASSAWGVRTLVDEAAHAAFGPPRYHQFRLSGWG
jgi:hypothetical protein